MNRYFYSKSRGLSRAKLTLTETRTQPHSNIQQKHALLIRYQHVQVLGISRKLIGGNEFVENQNPAVEFPPTLGVGKQTFPIFFEFYLFLLMFQAKKNNFQNFGSKYLATTRDSHVISWQRKRR